MKITSSTVRTMFCLDNEATYSCSMPKFWMLRRYSTQSHYIKHAAFKFTDRSYLLRLMVVPTVPMGGWVVSIRQSLLNHSNPHPASPNLFFQFTFQFIFGFPSLFLPSSEVHRKAKLACLVAGNHRMWTTNRLLLVATVSCSAICPDRAITSSFLMW